MSDAPPELGPVFGPDAFQALTGAGETAMKRLRAQASITANFNAHTNIVSKTSLADLWRRHMLDSAQLIALIPHGAHVHLDFGSGAGFPGLVIAAMLAGREGFHTTLVESVEKKCVFLRDAVSAMALEDRVSVVRGRIEDLPPFRADLVTARAVADLPTLLSYAQAFSARGTLLLFPKGRTAGDELTAARQHWKLQAEMIESQSDSSGSIVAVRFFAPLHTSKSKPKSRR